MAEVIVSVVELANKLAIEAQKNDEKLNDIFDSIEQSTRVLLDDISVDQKYKVVTEVEYLFVRARIQIEWELIKVKQLLADNQTPAALRTFFLKRSQYLAEVSVKLSTIREDVAALQKIQYTFKSQNLFK